MGEPLDALGLYYDERSYVEPGMVQGGVPSGGPPGMTGRQVAGKGFLDAYLDAGDVPVMCFPSLQRSLSVPAFHTDMAPAASPARHDGGAADSFQRRPKVL